jgi:hypothetical protein
VILAVTVASGNGAPAHNNHWYIGTVMPHTPAKQGRTATRKPSAKSGHSPKRATASAAAAAPDPAGYFFSQLYDSPHRQADPARLRLDQFKDPFDADAMHPSQRDYFRYPHKLRDIANDPAKLADFYADIISTAHRDFSSNTAAKTKTGIGMYSASLQDLGFERKQIKDLTSHIKSLRGTTKVIVAVGCQSETLLRARATAAATVFHRCVEASVHDLRVIFSGRHPLQDRVSILNEAALLKEYFEAALSVKCRDRYDELVEDRRIQVENESDNTRQNINKLFAMIQSAEGADGGLDLFLISNDFHLVRLSKDMRVVQSEAGADGRILHSLTLIGSERFVPENVRRELQVEAYSKRFYFEAISDFFRRNQFLDDRSLFGQSKTHRLNTVGQQLEVALFPCAPFLTGGGRRDVQFRLNGAVLFPFDINTFVEWVNDYFRHTDTDTDSIPSRMRLLRSMGGRLTQPTVRIAGEIRIDQTGQLDITLARNFDGVSHAVQLGLISTVNPDLVALTQHYNLLSLYVVASYAYQDESGEWMLLFHRRSSHKYIFSSCWDCAVEGPIYKDDLRGKETLDAEAAAVRLFERVHIESIDHQGKVPFSFETFGITFDAEAQQWSIQGVLKGGCYKPKVFKRPTNELVDEVASCKARPEDVARLIQEHKAKWNPSAVCNILFTLRSFGFDEATIKAAFDGCGLELTKLRGPMTRS